mmetsp:Transcript_56513/g.90018  ORF Transcript_56513/g.90018 Transcript_56513/m.90018 type:complete len:110 (-) Transcript_56513:73-402(-)
MLHTPAGQRMTVFPLPESLPLRMRVREVALLPSITVLPEHVLSPRQLAVQAAPDRHFNVSSLHSSLPTQLKDEDDIVANNIRDGSALVMWIMATNTNKAIGIDLNIVVE